MRDCTNDHSALALNTATLGHLLDGYGAGWSPEQIIDACAARGLAGIVFWRREIGDRAVEIGDKVRAAGMDVVGLCRTPFLVGPLAPKPDQALWDDLYASIDMATGLGSPVITIVVGGVIEGSRSVSDSLKRVTEITAKAADYAAERSVKLALEPLHPVYGGNRSCLTTVRDAVDICAAIDHSHVGLAVDVYHVWWDLSLGQELQRAKPEWILGYHLCDWLADTTEILLDRGMMGDGVADLKGIRAAVEGAGYSGPCEVEIFSAGNWWQKDPNDVLDVMVDRFRTVC